MLESRVLFHHGMVEYWKAGIVGFQKIQTILWLELKSFLLLFKYRGSISGHRARPQYSSIPLFQLALNQLSVSTS